jgi:hypothetical protein
LYVGYFPEKSFAAKKHSKTYLLYGKNMVKYNMALSNNMPSSAVRISYTGF